MTSAEIIFNGIITTIQCNENESIEEILKRFCVKINKNKEKIFFLYGGNIIDENKTFDEVANSEDKKRKKISILATADRTTMNSINNQKKSKYILCPKCLEVININIKDFKFKLFGCKNGHIIENLSFSDLNNSQFLYGFDESKIICDICKKVNKAKAYNNLFFICNTCNKNICPLCNSSHDKSHIIIEYEEKYFKCNLHNESNVFYCNDCNENICILCENTHNNHNKISLVEMLPDKNKLEEDKNNLKIIIDKFKSDIHEIIDKLKNVIYYIDSYYNIYNEIISGYEIQKRNYQILHNINYINKFNNNFINKLNIIINDNNIYSKFENLIYIYNKINSDDKVLNISYKEKIKKYKNEIKELKAKYENDINNQNEYKIEENDNGRYEGEFKNNKFEGKGIFYYTNGPWKGDKYVGEWKEGLAEGKGTYYFNNGPNKGDIYEGDWKKGNKEGKGVYYYNDGNKYEGEFKNDKFEGKGIYYFNNGDTYEGEWKNDKYEGKGIYYFNNGDRDMGDYLNSKKIGKHVTLTNNGNVKTKFFN